MQFGFMFHGVESELMNLFNGLSSTSMNKLLDKLEAELSFNKKRLLTGLFNLMWQF